MKNRTILLTTIFAICISLPLLAQQNQTAKQVEDRAEKTIRTYMEAFNTGEAKMRTFVQENMAESTLKQRSMEDRLSVYKQMHEDMKSLALEAITDVRISASQMAFVSLVHAGNGNMLEFTFLFEPEEPNKLLGIRVEMTDKSPSPQKQEKPAVNIVTTKEFPLTQIKAYLDRIKDYGFSGAVLVADHGKIVHEQNFGFTNRAKKSPITSDTVFDIGSNVKDFTKVAIYQLVESGKISLDDPLKKYFSDLPSEKAGITVQQLLTHRAGLPLAYGRDVDPLSKEEFLKRFFDTPLISAPGTEFRYSNPGFSLLAAIIEKVSGKTFDTYVAENISKKIGLTQTGYSLLPWKADNIAHSYENGSDQGSTFDYPHVEGGQTWNLRGNGGMLSTLKEMYKFYSALRHGDLIQKDHVSNIVRNGGNDMLVGGNGVHFFDYHIDSGSEFEIVIASTDAEHKAMTLDQRISDMITGRKVTTPPALAKLPETTLKTLAGKYKTVNGATLNFAMNNDGALSLTADDQGGINALHGITDTCAECPKLSSRAESIVNDADHGKYETWANAVGLSGALDRIQKREEPMRKERETKLGKFISANTVGTFTVAPSNQRMQTTMQTNGAFTSIVRESYEHGTSFVEIQWGPQGGIVGAGRGYGGIEFRPESQEKFVSYDMENNSVQEIDLKKGINGAITISIPTSGGNISAVKEK